MAKKVTTEDFISLANSLHSGRYSYPKTLYTRAKDKVVITCHLHGDFSQTADSHLQGHGCPLCGGSHIGSNPSFIQKAKKVHGDKYGYSRVNYVNSHTKVEIQCMSHGDFFLQAPTHHLSGKGCTKCVGKHRPSTEEFITKVKKVHGDVFDFTPTVYGKDNSCKVVVVCKKHQCSFTKSAANLLKGQGCPRCSKMGFKTNSPAILYYLRIKGGFFKIGVTNNTVGVRYNNRDLALIEDSYVVEFKLGYDAYVIEQVLLSLYKDLLYSGEPILTSGNTEIFATDVLGVFHD